MFLSTRYVNKVMLYVFPAISPRTMFMPCIAWTPKLSLLFTMLVRMINEMVVTVEGRHLSICSSNCFNVVLIDLLELLERGSQVHQ